MFSTSSCVPQSVDYVEKCQKAYTKLPLVQKKSE